METILIVGGGGREHALAWNLGGQARGRKIFCAPGNAGTAALGENLPIASEDLDGLVAWAMRERPDLVVVGPEAPLCAGLVDRLDAAAIRAFGPPRAAARIEGSKQFAKEVMRAAGVPTARAQSCDSLEAAQRAAGEFGLPLVIKADGLAAGKGVVICRTPEEVDRCLEAMLSRRCFGAAGDRVLIEEFLEGEEASILALVDGRRAVLLPSAQDHKRIFDGDRGPNTGGMGAYSPAPVVRPPLAERIRTEVFEPVLEELRRRGIVYRGVLYAGLMITPEGPRVLEFNGRFGDPETQAVLARLRGDLYPALNACLDGELDPAMLQWSEEAAVCVVMASGGYPGSYRKGLPIEGLAAAAELPGVTVFHAGTRHEGGRVLTAGGRVLGVTATGEDLDKAVARAYAAVGKIHFEGARFRRDIAARALRH